MEEKNVMADPVSDLVALKTCGVGSAFVPVFVAVRCR